MVKKTSLLDYINESLLDDENILMNDAGEEVIKNEILKFLKENYFIKDRCKISKKPINGKYIVDCDKSLYLKNRNTTSLTNEYFEFGVVDGIFDCSLCDSLISLKGAPKKVSSFHCHHCKSLKSLEGSPKEVGEDFYCSYCESLKSLEGSPKEVGKNFYCRGCNSLTSLKGAPKEVGGEFSCSYCNSLTSLKGVPKEVGGDFYCSHCKTQFFIDDVGKVSKVKGKIICWS